MSQELIDHSPDLKRLVDEGYSLEIRSGYALVHDVPYVNSNKEQKSGVLVSSLNMSGNRTVKPDNHVIYFIGGHPCDFEGNEITGIKHTSQSTDLGHGIRVDHSFSNKPPNGFNDYYEKFLNYIRIFKAPIHMIGSNATPQVYKPRVSPSDSPFNYMDTNSSRANIGQITNKLEKQRIGIVGLGGTGSYVLDFVAKTPVKEIHLYDGDALYSHNAFRMPGAVSLDELEKGHLKTDYHASVYQRLHRGIVPHGFYLDEDTVGSLTSLDFVFVCIDSGSIKRTIVDTLYEQNIPFIDTGIGLNSQQESLAGMSRITVVTRETTGNWRDRISLSSDDENDLYTSNIQVAEINCITACLAVIEWKKRFGFYFQLPKHDFTVYDISSGEIIND